MTNNTETLRAMNHDDLIRYANDIINTNENLKAQLNKLVKSNQLLERESNNLYRRLLKERTNKCI